MTLNGSPGASMLAMFLQRPFNIDCNELNVCPQYLAPAWDEWIDLAAKHQVAPLVYSSLVTSDINMPDDVPSRLRMMYLIHQMRLDAVLAPAVRQAVDALGAEGIAPVLLKGAALAYSVYPEPVHRSYSDIDLLLPENELEPARELLLRSGFSSKDEGEKSHHLEPLYAPGSDVGVELHAEILSEPHPYLLETGSLLNRSRPAVVAERQVRILSQADALFLACVHLSYAHRYQRLPMRHLIDILAISSARRDEVDWELLVQTARQSRAAGAVFWPLHLATTFLKAPVPRTVLRQLAPSTMLRKAVSSSMSAEHILDERSLRTAFLFHKCMRLVALLDGCSRRERARALRNGVRNGAGEALSVLRSPR